MRFKSEDFTLTNPMGPFDKNAVLYITTDGKKNKLQLIFTNNTGQNLKLKGGAPVDKTDDGKASTFLIDFSKILTEDQVQKVEFTNSDDPDAWKTAYFPSSQATHPPALGIAPKEDIQVGAGDQLTFELTNIECTTDIPDNFEVLYFNFAGVDPVSFAFIYPLSLLKERTGNPLPVSLTYSDVVHNISVNPAQGFVEDVDVTMPIMVDISYDNANPIENGFTINFKNDTGKPLNPSKAADESGPKITVSFLLGEGDNAITTVSAAKDLGINVDTPDDYKWDVTRGSDTQNFFLTPQAEGILGPNDTLQIKVEKLIVPSSFLPTEISSVRLQTNNFPGYDDDLFVFQMEKAEADPVIDKFVVQPTSINYGEDVKLTWKTVEAWKVIIEYELRDGTPVKLNSANGDIKLSATDFVPPVKPDKESTSFKLSIYKTGDTPWKQDEKTISVKQPDAEIVKFEASPRYIQINSGPNITTVEYDVKQPKTLSIDRKDIDVKGKTEASGNLPVDIKETKYINMAVGQWSKANPLNAWLLILGYNGYDPVKIGEIGDGTTFETLPLSLTNVHKKKIYVANGKPNCVYEIDQITKTRTSRTFGGTVMALTSDGSRLFVYNDIGGPPTLTMYDTDSGQPSAPVSGFPGPGPYCMAVSPGGTMLVAGAHGQENQLYFAQVTPGSIGTMNTITVDNGQGPRYILFGKNEKVYVANYGGNSLSVLSSAGGNLTLEKVVLTNTISASATQPRALALTGTSLFVACSGSNEVLVFDTGSETFTKSITVGNRPFNLEFNLNETELFVSNFGENTVSVVDVAGQSEKQKLTVGNAPACTKLNRSGTLLFVSNYCDKSLCAVDITEEPYTVIPGSIDLGQGNGNPIDITTYDDSDGYTNVFVAKEYFKPRNEACSADATDAELDMSVLSMARPPGNGVVEGESFPNANPNVNHVKV